MIVRGFISTVGFLRYFNKMIIDQEVKEKSAVHARSTNGSAEEVVELAELLRLVDHLPSEYQGELYQALHRLVTCFELRQQALVHIQDALSQMNLDIRYLIFDLDATRRERDEYRRQLTEQGL